jgi:putative colanic acid biosynthesis glycosyltransferase WcaI
MRILLVSQYFAPEITAPAVRLHAFAAGLSARGHQVEVLCEVPNHPTGIVAPGYGGRLSQLRRMDGFEARYVWVYATPSKSPSARITNYLSYAAMATLVGLRRYQVDVILASSPPLPVGAAGAVLALRHRIPWVLDVRDLWPDLALTLGQVGKGHFLRAAQRLEARLYRSAAAITAATEPFEQAIESRGGADKVTVIPNGTSDIFLHAGAADPVPSLLGAGDGRFTWMHAGNLGLVHGLESAVTAARTLGDGFRLVLLGYGPRQAALQELAKTLPAGTVEFRDPVPQEEAARLMRASDALLVSVSPMPGLEGTVASKLYDCCAVGRPVIVSAGGETKRIVDGSGAALCVAPGDAEALAAAVRRLRDDDALRKRLVERGRSFAEANSRERGVELLEAVLRRVAAGKRRPS